MDVMNARDEHGRPIPDPPTESVVPLDPEQYMWRLPFLKPVSDQSAVNLEKMRLALLQDASPIVEISYETMLEYLGRCRCAVVEDGPG